MIFGIALVARVSLDFIIKDILAYITFTPAVVITAILCGLWPSVAVAAVSSVVGTMWIDPGPENGAAYHVTGFILFVFTAALIIFLTDALRHSHRELLIGDHQLTLVNNELTHRIANLLPSPAC